MGDYLGLKAGGGGGGPDTPPLIPPLDPHMKQTVLSDISHTGLNKN